MVTDSPPSADAVANGGGVSSPQSRRRSLHSPWASVVRGDSEQNSSPTAAAAAAASPRSSSSPPVEEASASENSLIESSGSELQPESSENNGDNNAGGPRRPAWNRPLNGVVEPASVMGGAISWPALSETTRPVQRSSSDASRPVSDGSVPPSQVNAPIISQPPQRSANSNHHGNHHSNHHGNHGNSAGNHPNPARLRSRNRGGGSSGSAGGSGGNSGSGVSGGGSSAGGHGTFNQPSSSYQTPPPFPVVEVQFGIMPHVLDNNVRGPRPIGGVGGPPTGNDHSSPRNNSRRSNYGPRPRGDGQYHNNHGRRDQDRREVHHPPQYAPPPPMAYMPPPLPPGAAPFMAPPPMRVFPGQMGFDMGSPFIYVPPMPPPDSFRAMPIVSPLPPMMFPPASENPLTNMIVKQIDFYFSDDNLVKDSFLRSKMDDQGWVPLSLIASFRRVQQLTKDIALILESLRFSLVVEVQGDKVRRRNEWSKWLLSTGVVNSDPASGTSSSAPENVLATSLQVVSLNEAGAHANGIVDESADHTEMAAAQLPRELANGDIAEEAEEEVHSNNL